ncbi:multicopper oxidase-domain-containing protein [Exophiala viscosa]|uniref:multicopper oxidase-domain-containing protein n=1 Tax=Exophiala viscosa TaxID=2486360 RepID=UPI00219780CF|nr:multicopper oxidase-domain-containing protein [Exophiala viscosa]
MKLTKSSSLAVVGLAAGVVAEWEAWDAAITTVAASASNSWADWDASPTTTVTTTATTTVYKETTTVYHSTVYIGPGFCATTTVTVDGNGQPFPPIATKTLVAVHSSKTSTASADPSWSTVTSPDPTMTTDGSWLEWESDVSTIGTDGAVYTWTGDAIATTVTIPAPQYTGWSDNGSWPEAGSAHSNVSTPNGPIYGGSGCNSADDRSKWCGGQSISSDWYTGEYSTGNTCSYDFTITNTTLDLDGSGEKLAFAINGQVPGPLIECNWGDLLVVTVHNELTDNSTSIHWHGITQKGTNDQDGVPGVTECGIAPGFSRTYTMQLSQYGTSWYHSHSVAQYGDGIRGPIVIHGPATANYDIDMGPITIDDTFNVTAAQQNERVAHTGPTGTVNYLLNGKNTLPDLSAGQHALWDVQSGKKHLFRLINTASQNMYSVHFDQHTMTVIAADLVPIVPYETEWLNIGIGQRYDVIVEMNQPVAGYFLRAVTQTGCPSGCANSGLGAANGIFLYSGAKATLPTSTYGSKNASDFAICLDEPLESLVPYVSKSGGSASAFSATASTLPAGNVATVATNDDGSVFRWFLNNGNINVNYTQPTLQTIAQHNGTNYTSLVSNSITLKGNNTWVYFVIQNQFFAAHPMHLHGHDFSLLGQGVGLFTSDMVSTLNFDNPMRRDTAMLIGSAAVGQQAGYTVIGFQTDNPGAWLMHCHIVWHVDGGLALQWIERPSDISDYAGKDEFQSECAALKTWQEEHPKGVHTSGESGLKKRGETFFDRELEALGVSVKRDFEFLSASGSGHRHTRRSLGDGYKPRHVRW